MLEHVGWTKSLDKLLEVILDRLTAWFRRKPKLYVHFQPNINIWCIARSGPQPDATEYMHIICSDVGFALDSDRGTVIVDAFPEGTVTQVKAMDEIEISPGVLIKGRVSAIVAPVIAEKGKDWTGKIIFVSQFHRKYKSKVTLKWAGPPTPHALS